VHVVVTLALLATLSLIASTIAGIYFIDFVNEHGPASSGVPRQSELEDAEAEELARRFAPILRRDSRELFVPIRQEAYVGETQLMTPVGALPLAFEIEADSLGQASQKFSEVAAVAVERAVRELQEMRRQQSSSIVIPEGIPPGLGGMGMGGGGGKIKLP